MPHSLHPILPAILLGLASLASLAPAQSDHQPLERARRGDPPPHDLLSRLQEAALDLGRTSLDREARILVVPIDFPDLPGETDSETFSLHFFDRSEPGSLAASFERLSGGRLRVTGEVAPWIRSRAPRRLLERIGPAPSAALNPIAYPLLLTRLESGLRRRLAEFDLVVFVVAGPRVERWGTILWPHAGPIRVGGRTMQKIVLAERSRAEGNFSRRTLRHEFGHSLGIPDKYCYLSSLGIEHDCEIDPVGRHCLMGWGRSPCAWCRIHLGWTRPVVLAPGVDQDLRLTPLADGGGIAQIYLGTRGQYLLIADHEDELRVWRIGRPWERVRNHIFWIDLECLVAADPTEAGEHALPGGIRLTGVHRGDDGEIRFGVRFDR